MTKEEKKSPDDKSIRLVTILIIQTSIIFWPVGFEEMTGGGPLAYNPSIREIAFPASALG